MGKMKERKREKMKERKIKSVFTILLAIVVFVTMCMPSFILASTKKAEAKSIKGINIGTDNIVAPSSGSWTTSDQYLYIGRHGGAEGKTATKYRVLQKNNGIMLIDNDKVVGYSPYSDKTDTNRNKYAASFLRNEIYDGKQFFTDIELNSIASTTLNAKSAYTENGFTFVDDSSSNNKIFLLSVYEVTKYYKNGAGAKTGWPTWWTRSADSSDENKVGVVSTNGAVIEADYGVTGGVSSTANLNLNSKDILFSADVDFSKTGALAKVGTTDTHTWKLTLKDSSKALTAKKGTIGANKKVTIPVTITKGSDIDQLSVVITNGDINSSNTEILYYGKMDGITTTSKTEQNGTFTLPSDFNINTNKVYLLAEDINTDTSVGGGSITDYTSEPLEISFGYLIEFNTNGATSGTASSQIVKENDKATEPTGILKTGYILKGWFENSSLTGSAYNFATAVTKAMTLYAKWEAQVYKITYNLNGGTEPTPANPASYTIESSTITLRDPSKEGLSFAGWTTDGVTTPVKGVTIPAKSTGAKEYKANWNATITFDTKGGSIVPDKVVAENTVVKESDITVPTNGDLHFTGWYDDENYTTKHDFTKPVTKNTKLYAKWERKVTFNSNGGSSIDAVMVEDGEAITAPDPAPTKANLHFAGWYKDQDCTDGQEFDFATETITGDKTLYAKWTADVTFDAKGGTPAPSKQVIKEGEKVTAPAETITKLGYTFKGWYDNASYSGDVYDFSAAVMADLLLYAKWTTVEYEISIDLNGGSEPTPSNPKEYTIEDTITLKEPTKENVSFAGWTSESEGITTPQKEVTITPGNTGGKDYKANWNATISFDTKGGSQIEDKVVAENTIVSEDELGTTTKENLNFAGWYDDENCTIKHDFTKPVSQNTKLYAKWEAIVTFDSKGGSEVEPEIVKEGEKATKPTDPTKRGYAFNAWYLKETSQEQEDVIKQEQQQNNPLLYAINPVMLLLTNIDESGDADTNTDADIDADEDTNTDEDTKPDLTNEPFDFETIITENITLVANWDVVNYDISYRGLTNAKVVANPVTYNVESDEITLNNPKKEGYIFTGWTSDGVAKPTKNMTIAKGSVGDKTFTANWAVRTSDKTNLGLLITLAISSLIAGASIELATYRKNSKKQ